MFHVAVFVSSQLPKSSFAFTQMSPRVTVYTVRGSAHMTYVEAFVFTALTAALISCACTSSVDSKSVISPLRMSRSVWLAFSAIAAVFCSMAVHISTFTVLSNSVFQYWPLHVCTL